MGIAIVPGPAADGTADTIASAPPNPLERRLGAPTGHGVTARVDLVVTDDWTTPSLLEPLERLGTGRSAVPIVAVHDHTGDPDRYTGADRERVLANLAARDRLLARTGGTAVAGAGVQHHALPELGLLRPDMLVLVNDSHAATLGAFGVLALAAQPTTLAAAIHTGRVRLRVPDTLGVELVGALPEGVSARDAVRALLSLLRGPFAPARPATGRVLVFHGPGLARLTLAERALLANAAPEAVATSALFPVDERVAAHYRRRGIEAPTHAAWVPEVSVRLDLSSLEPLAARPGDPSDAVATSQLPATRVDRVFVGTCAGGTFEEIAAFARSLGARAAVPTTVTPATRGVAERLARAGITARLEAAGVVVEPPGCGPCFGFGPGRLGEGEVAVTTGNRNAVGRHGAGTARVILASGATAGAAARTGTIGRGTAQPPARRPPNRLELPRRGNVLRLHGTITTDDITPSAVPGVGTSNTGDPAVLLRLLFHHLDPDLHRLDLRDVVLVADHDFGMGSNRASSVRALLVAGVRAVVARSIAPLYAAGARDEGLVAIVLDDDAFHAAATPDATVVVDPAAGHLLLDGRAFALPPVDAVERALAAAGGVLPYLLAGGDLGGPAGLGA